MNRHLLLSLAVAGCLLGGCATHPENVMPAYVSDMSYTCEQLAQEQARLGSALAAASDAQRRARSGDTVGVIFLGLPTASLSGSNQASNIARLKGELDALQRAAIRKDCGMELLSIDELTAKREKEEASEGKPSDGIRGRASDPRTNQGR